MTRGRPRATRARGGVSGASPRARRSPNARERCRRVRRRATTVPGRRPGRIPRAEGSASTGRGNIARRRRSSATGRSSEILRDERLAGLEADRAVADDGVVALAAHGGGADQHARRVVIQRRRRRIGRTGTRRRCRARARSNAAFILSLAVAAADDEARPYAARRLDQREMPCVSTRRRDVAVDERRRVLDLVLQHLEAEDAVAVGGRATARRCRTASAPVRGITV